MPRAQAPRPHVLAELRDVAAIVRYQRRVWVLADITGIPVAWRALADDLQTVLDRAAALRGYAVEEHRRLTGETP